MDPEATEDLIRRFCRERWTNATTVERNEYILLRLVRDHGSRPLGDLTPTDVLRWCAGADSPRTLANNTIRGRTAVVATLLRWCARSGIPAPAPEYLTDSDSPLRQFRPTYGKAQSQNPPRWLTKEEAYSTLLNALDDTPMGRRDELVIRLGLAGVRAQEIVGLQIGNLRDLDTDHPSLYWTGKRYKPLHIALGPQTVVALRRYLADYRNTMAEDPPPDAPLICRRRPGHDHEVLPRPNGHRSHGPGSEGSRLGRPELLSGPPLPAGRLEHLLVLLLAHPLAPLLYERTHGPRP